MSKSKKSAEAPKGFTQPRGGKTMSSHLAKIAEAKMKKAIGAIIALLVMSADNTRKSGRSGGIVYQRNGRARNFVVPALVQNAATTGARSLLAQFSQNWEALTESNRQSWLNIDWLFKSNRFGVPILIKGKDAYVALNCNLVNIGAPPIDDAPVSSGGVPGITDLLPSADQSSTLIQLGYTPDPTDADVAHIIFATPPLRAGVSRPRKSDFRVIATLGGSTASPFDVTSAYTTKYGSTWQSNAGYVGAKIFFKAVPININSGVEGGNIIGSCFIAA